MSALDTLRALSRSEPVRAPSNEINEINEITPPSAPLRRGDEGLLSLNSFLSSPKAQNADDLDERAAIVEYGSGVPRASKRKSPPMRSNNRLPRKPSRKA